MIFKYSGIDQYGKKMAAKVEAINKEEAKRWLKSQKIMYKTLLEETFDLSQAMHFQRKRKITSGELSTLSRELSLYLRSGISLVNTIGLLLNQYTKEKKIALFLTSIKNSLDEGKNFYSALEKQNAISLPAFYKQSIKVSEDSGVLDEVLLELSLFLKNQDRVTKQIQGAFAYPLFILVVSVFMVAFMLAFVVPKITAIFEQMHQELPMITQLVIRAGDFLVAYWSVLLVGGVGIFLGLYTAFRLSKRFRYLVDMLLLHIPFFGKILENSELGRFAYISSILFRAGVPFVQTVNLASKILKNSVIANVFEEASVKVVEGGKLSTSLQKSSYVIDTSFIQAIALGEDTSEVSPILSNLSDLYFEENKDKITIFLSLLEPVLMLIVGGIIGVIVASMLLPIFSIDIQ